MIVGQLSSASGIVCLRYVEYPEAAGLDLGHRVQNFESFVADDDSILSQAGNETVDALDAFGMSLGSFPLHPLEINPLDADEVHDEQGLVALNSQNQLLSREVVGQLKVTEVAIALSNNGVDPNLAIKMTDDYFVGSEAIGHAGAQRQLVFGIIQVQIEVWGILIHIAKQHGGKVVVLQGKAYRYMRAATARRVEVNRICDFVLELAKGLEDLGFGLVERIHLEDRGRVVEGPETVFLPVGADSEDPRTQIGGCLEIFDIIEVLLAEVLEDVESTTDGPAH